MAKYGVFSLGQLWSLHSSAGWMRGYPTRLAALQAALDALKADHDGERGLLIQDETGFVAAPSLADFLVLDAKP